jgi:hypothetical protein
MWVFKYLVCIVKDHIWVGSHYQYCLRCGKLEMAPGYVQTSDVARVAESDTVIAE